MYHLHKHLILTTIIFFFITLSTANAGIRCGNDIISTGDTKTQVLVKIKNCGEILEKDSYIKGSTYTTSDNYKTTTQTKIDLWSTRIKERGSYYCYPLTFENGELATIGKWSRCK